MEIRVRATGAVMFENEFRNYLLQNNGPSYDVLTPEVMESLGIDPVLEGPQATGGTVYQYSQRAGIETIDGKFYTRYVLGPIFSDPKAEAEYKAKKDEEKAASVRAERNRRIAALDWTQGKDIPESISAPAAVIRQALRDVPAQDGFPWNVVWPTETE